MGLGSDFVKYRNVKYRNVKYRNVKYRSGDDVGEMIRRSLLGGF